MAIKFSSSFSDTRSFSDVGIKVLLLENTQIKWSVPGDNSDCYRAEFSFNETDYVWVGVNQDVSVPTLNVITETNQVDMRPKPKNIRGGDVISFITSQSGVQLAVNLFSLPKV